MYRTMSAQEIEKRMEQAYKAYTRELYSDSLPLEEVNKLRADYQELRTALMFAKSEGR